MATSTRTEDGKGNATVTTVVTESVATASAPQLETTGSPPITLYYKTPYAGRAELIRLIGRAGGLKIEENNNVPEDMTPFGSPGSLPVIDHNGFKLAQSGAIEGYCANIAPRFASLTAQQKAKDHMFACIKEDILGGFAKVMWGSKNPEEITTTADKWFGVLESMVPAEGFVNGESFPTVADLVVLNVCTSRLPFAAGMKFAEYDYKKHAKVAALADRTLAHENLAGYTVNDVEFGGY